MIAKAEVLQASIGVSCNEQDLQDCLIGAAAPSHEGSIFTSCDAVVPDGVHQQKVANEQSASLSTETSEPDAANFGHISTEGSQANAGRISTEGSQAATAAGLLLTEDKPYR